MDLDIVTVKKRFCKKAGSKGAAFSRISSEAPKNKAESIALLVA